MQHPNDAKRGFTLVEVIVVLVILAILAAIMIPAMTGWIDKAKEKRLVVACRTCVAAAQTLVAETYGATDQATVPGDSDVIQLAGVPGSVSDITLADTAIATLTYTDAASSDYVTYTRSPGPKYEFGTGLTLTQTISGVATALQGQNISNPVRSAGPNAEATNRYLQNYNNAIAAMQNIPGLMASLNSGNTVWTIQTLNGQRQIVLYNGPENDLAGAGAGSRVPVTVYNLDNPSAPSVSGMGTVGTATTTTGRHHIINYG